MAIKLWYLKRSQSFLQAAQYLYGNREVIQSFGAGCLQCADDTQVYFSVSLATELVEAVHMLNHCLEAVMGWRRANKLKLNTDMIEAL